MSPLEISPVSPVVLPLSVEDAPVAPVGMGDEVVEVESSPPPHAARPRTAAHPVARRSTRKRVLTCDSDIDMYSFTRDGTPRPDGLIGRARKGR
jgi:hypothetical protein